MFQTTRITPDQARAFLQGKKHSKITIASLGTIYFKQSGAVNLEVIKPAHGEILKQWLEQIDSIQPLAVGSVFSGLVTRIYAFGCFVSFFCSHQGMIRTFEGLVHISEITDNHHVFDIRQEVEEGKLIKVKIIEIDKMGRVNLSAKVI